MSHVTVGTTDQLNQAITQYIAQGFTLANQTAMSATMMRKKEFNVIWAIIGFFLCLLPLLIYCIVYATEQDKMVEIRIDPSAALPAGANTPMLSADGRYWWDGDRWQDADHNAPGTAPRSQDGTLWWDGSAWRPEPTIDRPAMSVGTPSEAFDTTAEADDVPDAGSEASA